MKFAEGEERVFSLVDLRRCALCESISWSSVTMGWLRLVPWTVLVAVVSRTVFCGRKFKEILFFRLWFNDEFQQ